MVTRLHWRTAGAERARNSGPNWPLPRTCHSLREKWPEHSAFLCDQPDIPTHNRPPSSLSEEMLVILLSTHEKWSDDSYVSSFNHSVSYACLVKTLTENNEHDSAVFRHLIRQIKFKVQQNREQTAFLTWLNSLHDKKREVNVSFSLFFLLFKKPFFLLEMQWPLLILFNSYFARKQTKKDRKTDDNPGICWRWGAPCRLSWAGGRSVPWARGTTHTGSPPHHWRSPTRRRPTAANGRVRTLRTDTNMRTADHCIWTDIWN